MADESPDLGALYQQLAEIEAAIGQVLLKDGSADQAAIVAMHFGGLRRVLEARKDENAPPAGGQTRETSSDAPAHGPVPALESVTDEATRQQMRAVFTERGHPAEMADRLCDVLPDIHEEAQGSQAFEEIVRLRTSSPAKLDRQLKEIRPIAKAVNDCLAILNTVVRPRSELLVSGALEAFEQSEAWLRRFNEVNKRLVIDLASRPEAAETFRRPRDAYDREFAIQLARFLIRNNLPLTTTQQTDTATDSLWVALLRIRLSAHRIQGPMVPSSPTAGSREGHRENRRQPGRPPPRTWPDPAGPPCSRRLSRPRSRRATDVAR
jgi:hypothetical protein